MDAKQKSIKDGVADAWDFWLSQHDVSVPMLISDAISETVTRWLDANGEDIVRRILDERT